MKETLAPFLAQYDAVLFDMDGVITSEENYWDIAALVVYETLNSRLYFGAEDFHPEETAANVREIRRQIFCEDRTIRLVKNRGVNSNWDLAWLVLSTALILETRDDFEGIYAYLKNTEGDTFALYDAVGRELARTLSLPVSETRRLGPLWERQVLCFQEWLLGDQLFPKIMGKPVLQSGKSGMMYREQPIVDRERLFCLLRLLAKSGKRLGIGTGRPWLEIESVLEQWGARKFFARDGVINYDDVTDAEVRQKAAGRDAAFTKPHPYMFLKARFGDSITDEDIINGNYDRAACARTLVVGDAGADLFAAFAGGFHFAAVLTGVQGEAARSFFEREHATYILHNVLELMEERPEDADG